MTDEQMDKIDALVAEHVMGWHRSSVEGIPGWMRTEPNSYAGKVWVGYRYGDCKRTEGELERGADSHFHGLIGPQWSPTRDGNAMLEVMQAVGISIIASVDGWYAMKADDISHTCIRGTDVPSIVAMGREGEQWEAQETPQLAVALAALKAKGIEVPT